MPNENNRQRIKNSKYPNYLLDGEKAIKIPHHDTQNEIIRLMAFFIKKDIAKKYQR